MVSQFIALKESIHSNDILAHYHYAAAVNIYTWKKNTTKPHQQQQQQIYLIKLNSEGKGRMSFLIDNVMIPYLCIDILLCERWWQPEGADEWDYVFLCIEISIIE